MKNIKNSPIIILDIILDADKKMSKIEKLIFKILKSKNERLKKELIWITEVPLQSSYLWIGKLRKNQNKSTFVLYSESLNKFSEEYKEIKIKKIGLNKKVVAYSGGTLLPLEFKFSKKDGELDWIMKIYSPIKKNNSKKVDNSKDAIKELPKKKKNWITRKFNKIIFSK